MIMQSAQQNSQTTVCRAPMLAQSTRVVPGSASQQQKSGLLNNPGFGQSFSGSETDVSTSTENLTHEERYVIKHTQRQEPQGEETLTTSSCSRSMDASSCDTLIIHHDIDGGKWFTRNAMIQGSEYSPQEYLNRHSQFLYGKQANQNPPYARISSTAVAPTNISKIGNPLAKQQYQDIMSKKHLVLYQNNGKETSIPLASDYDLTSDTYSNFDDLYSAHEINGIPDHYLDKSEVLKHLAKEVKGNISDNSNPGSNSQLNQVSDPDSQENLASGHKIDSQSIGQRLQDLSVKTSLPVPANVGKLPPPPAYLVPKVDWKPQCIDGVEVPNMDLSDAAFNKPVLDPMNSMAMVGQLSNNDLLSLLNQEQCKIESSVYCQRDVKIAKFERELMKIEHCQDELVRSAEKREALERAARSKLQIQVQLMQERNRYLEGQLDQLTTHMNCGLGESQREPGSRDVTISQLMAQNRELMAARERQEIELGAQSATLQEQRTHIDILDSALTNSQANVVRLEEECRKKQVYVERVGQLQRMLASLQLTSDRREQMERRLRQQLEREIQEVRDKHCDLDPRKEVDDLRAQLREASEKVIQLEGEVNKWEQRYLGVVKPMDYCAALSQGSGPSCGDRGPPPPFSSHLSLIPDQSGTSPGPLDNTQLMKVIHSQMVCDPLKGGHCSQTSLTATLDAACSPRSTGHSRSSSGLMLDNKLLGPSSYLPLASGALSGLPDYLPSNSMSLGGYGLSLEDHQAKRGEEDRAQSSPSVLSSSQDSDDPEVRAASDTDTADNTTNYRKVIDEHLKKLDEEILAKDKIIRALQKENKSTQEYWEV